MGQAAHPETWGPSGWERATWLRGRLPVSLSHRPPIGSWGVAGGLSQLQHPVAGWCGCSVPQLLCDRTVLGLGLWVVWTPVLWPSLTCPVPLCLRPPRHFSGAWYGLWGTATTGQVSPVYRAHSCQRIGHVICVMLAQVAQQGRLWMHTSQPPRECLSLPTQSLSPRWVEEKWVCMSCREEQPGRPGYRWPLTGRVHVVSCPAPLPAPHREGCVSGPSQGPRTHLRCVQTTSFMARQPAPEVRPRPSPFSASPQTTSET